jgi:SPW repeat-containing protein
MKTNEKRPRHEPFSAADLSQIHWASGANILFGAWLFIAPWLLSYAPDVISWNDTIAGAALMILATLRYIRPFGRFWIGWINALIGLWMIATPFVLNCEYITAQVNDMTIGIAVFVAGAISGSVRSFNR